MLKSTHKTATPPPILPSLPPGWTEHKAPTGHSYYYNAETKISTYTRPTLGTPTPFPAAQIHITTNLSNPYSGPSYPHTFTNSTQGQTQADFRGRGSFKGGNGYQGRRSHHPEDRPKHRYAIPNCAPWTLVKTKLGRRFVHNTETKESFWKFPEDVMKGVVEFDRMERERREQRERGESSENQNDRETVAVEGKDARRCSITPAEQADEADLDSEYEEVEVTEEEGEDDEQGNLPKRHRTEEPDSNLPVEFNEDDIAYQLAAMGEEYGLDPGEYGEGDWEEGAEGLPLSEEDSIALFHELLDDHHISPFTPWETLLSSGSIVDDIRYTVLPTTKARKAAWDIWSRSRIETLKAQKASQAQQDPRIPYIAFLHAHASPRLFWKEFQRKHRKESELRNSRLSDKELEKIYRDHITRLKLPQSAAKSDLSTLLKSIPLKDLNRASSSSNLPSAVLTDLRYITLPAAIRDSLIDAYISTLPPPPAAHDNGQDDEDASERRKDRDRREKALAERERRVQEEKRRQRRDLEFGKGRLREEELELERAMKIGKGGLKAHLNDKEERGDTE
ncbi:hypothetical protein M501DRAFT_1017955 [Patellaria atrata CBS 101060]|uniref:WW domain-containing protein n=1 Tax=Patellaria atrata CBS 101060 TaxID=1346257 RepID=A0A9P4S7R3_9PEZI|nr:hypothetical protein M501DRAFT_1017955 [Patellaria atrata CBS 101060]